MNELSTILVTLISAMGGMSLLTLFVYWRQNKRNKDLEVQLNETNVDKARIESKTDEWNLYKDQLEIANNRIKDLLQLNQEKEKMYADRISEMDDRFKKQTTYLRDIQRSLRKALEEINRLTVEKGKMQRIIDHLRLWFCRRCYKDCQRREPQQSVKPMEYIPLPEDGGLETAVSEIIIDTKETIAEMDETIRKEQNNG